MRASLYRKFILAYISFGITAFLAIATVSSKLTDVYLLRSGSSTLYDEANLIASSYSNVYSGKSLSLSEAYPQLQAVSTFLQVQIWVVDIEGKILVDSQGNMDGQTLKDFDPTATAGRHYVTGNFFGAFSHDVLSVYAPIIGNYKTHGYVIIHRPMTMVEKTRNDILNIVYITFVIVFLLSLVILFVFQRIVYRPLKRIIEATKQYAVGNLRFITKVDSNDEMGTLADTLNYMSGELAKTEEYQRNFITNISHDFRSPLTSIKGYLEAMQDGTIPVELHGTYISRVLGETERLTKLTTSILTLNSLDAKHGLIRQSFEIERMIKRIAESFELQCDDKHLTMDLVFPEEIPPVHADPNKIEQVLYNLLGNAIKFSNHDSTITVTVRTERESVFVSVKDTGIGIPKKDLHKIFERFFKSDASRGKDKKGTGLGLAIVKEIIQAHGESIDVISTEGAGTEFIFSLSTATES